MRSGSVSTRASAESIGPRPRHRCFGPVRPVGRGGSGPGGEVGPLFEVPDDALELQLQPIAEPVHVAHAAVAQGAFPVAEDAFDRVRTPLRNRLSRRASPSSNPSCATDLCLMPFSALPRPARAQVFCSGHCKRKLVELALWNIRAVPRRTPASMVGVDADAAHGLTAL